MQGTGAAIRVVDASGKPIALSVEQNIAVKTLLEARRQADAAEVAGDLAIAQLILTLIVTAFLVSNFRQTRKALAQGERSLSEERQQNRNQLRPFSHIAQVFLDSVAVGAKAKLTLIVRNSGQSPAIRAQVSGEVRLGSTKDPIKLHFPAMHWAHWMLGANGSEITVPLESDHPVTDEQVAELKARSLWILLNGSITYTDIVGDEHITTFAYRTRDGVFEGRAQRTDGRPELIARPLHNFIDDPDDLRNWKTELGTRTDRVPL